MLQERKLPFARQKNQLDTASVPQELYSKLVTIPTGKPFIIAGGPRSVANVIVGREPRPIAGDKAKPARRSGDPQDPDEEVARGPSQVPAELGEDRVSAGIRASRACPPAAKK